MTKENTRIPGIPNIPFTPDLPTVILPETPMASKIVKEETEMTKLPKTGDTTFNGGLGLLLFTLSTGGLVLLRKK